MSSSLLKRFQASRESAPVESALDKPASILDKKIADAEKLVAAVEPTVPSTSDRKAGPGLHASGLPSEPVTKPVDAAGVTKDESADKNVVAAVKPAKPTSSDASGLPASAFKEPKADTAAVADDHADAEGRTAAAVQSVTPHHANEDLDPEAAQVQPASCIVPMPDHARETEEAYRAVEEATLHSAMEEFQRVQSGLESLRERIASDNEQGGLSAESAFFAAFAVESLLKRFNVTDRQTTASFESAVTVAEGKTVVNLESLNATLESVDAPVKEFGKRFAATIQRLLVPTYLALKATSTGLVKIAEEAEKLKSASDATVRVHGKSIAVGDTVSKNVAGDLAKAATWLGFLVGKFDKQAKQDYKHNRELANKAFENADEASKVVPAMKQVLEGWVDPRRKLGGKASDPIIGNYVFFKDQSLKYKGEDPTAKAFDKLANEAYPEVIGFQEGEGRVAGGSVEIKALTPKEIASLARQFELATQGASFGKSAWETGRAATSLVAVAAIPTMPLAGAALTLGYMVPFAAWLASYFVFLTKSVRRSDDLNSKPGEGILAEDLRTVYDALVTSQRLTFHVGYDAMRVLRKEIKLFKKIAKASLNAHAKASVEAFDQQTSLDGVSVNETAPNEPRQVPAEGHTVTAKEMMARQDSWEDMPASFQTIEDDAESTIPAVESMIQEGSELIILSKHYALEAEGDADAKPSPKFLERVKAFLRRIVDFFQRLWKQIAERLTGVTRSIRSSIARIRQYGFEAVDLRLTDLNYEAFNDGKVADFRAYSAWLTKAASVLDEAAQCLRHYPVSEENARKVYDGIRSLASNDFLPIADWPESFKIEIDREIYLQRGDEVSNHLVTPPNPVTVRKSEVLRFLEEADKAIEVVKALYDRQRKASDDFRAAEGEYNKKLRIDQVGGAALLEMLPSLIRVGTLSQSMYAKFDRWTRCIDRIGKQVKPKSEEASTESLADLPYWYRPATA